MTEQSNDGPTEQKSRVLPLSIFITTLIAAGVTSQFSDIQKVLAIAFAGVLATLLAWILGAPPPSKGGTMGGAGINFGQQRRGGPKPPPSRKARRRNRQK